MAVCQEWWHLNPVWEWANTGPGNLDGLKISPTPFFLTSSMTEQEGLILARSIIFNQDNTSYY